MSPLLGSRRADVFERMLAETGAGSARRVADVGSDGELAALVRLTTALRPAPIAPSDDFRATLRARLLAEPAPEPAARSTAAPDASGGGVLLPFRGVHARPRARLVAGAAALALVGTAGTAAAAEHALPGDRLYVVKRSVDAVQLALPQSDEERGERYLRLAEERLTEIEKLVQEPGYDETALSDALVSLGSLQDKARSLLVQGQGGALDPQVVQTLDGFYTAQQRTLATLWPKIPQVLHGIVLGLVRGLILDGATLAEAAASSCAGRCPPVTSVGALKGTSVYAAALPGSGGGAGTPGAPRPPPGHPRPPALTGSSPSSSATGGAGGVGGAGTATAATPAGTLTGSPEPSLSGSASSTPSSSDTASTVPTDGSATTLSPGQSPPPVTATGGGPPSRTSTPTPSSEPTHGPGGTPRPSSSPSSSHGATSSSPSQESETPSQSPSESQSESDPPSDSQRSSAASWPTQTSTPERSESVPPEARTLSASAPGSSTAGTAAGSAPPGAGSDEPTVTASSSGDDLGE